jgi:hypothetical protein
MPINSSLQLSVSYDSRFSVDEKIHVNEYPIYPQTYRQIPNEFSTDLLANQLTSECDVSLELSTADDGLMTILILRNENFTNQEVGKIMM